MNEKATQMLVDEHPDFLWAMIDFSIEEKAGVYCIYDEISGKAYIGASTNLKTRINLHISQLKKGENVNKNLQKIYNSGVFDLYFFTIEHTRSRMEAELMEAYWANAFGWDRLLNCKNITFSYPIECVKGSLLERVNRIGLQPVTRWGTDKYIQLFAKSPRWYADNKNKQDG